MIKDYYNRFDADSNYEKALFRAGKGLQSAELNEIQDQAFHQTKGIADALLKDGDLVQGGQAVVDKDTAKATLESGMVYIRGQVRTVEKAELNVKLQGVVDLGVWLNETVITELQDASLRDPAVDTRNYHEAGAARLKVECTWGLAGDSNSGDFYPVHKMDNGVLIVKQPPPQLDNVTVALARYDKEANGSYIVNGMRVSYLQKDNDKQEFNIAEGKAHVEGFEVAFPTSLRKSFPINPSLNSVVSEPHTFTPADNGEMRINLAHAPLANLQQVDVTLEKTVTVTHGDGVGDADPLPQSSVLEVISVTQASKTYSAGSDYNLVGNQIDWSASGDEPAPGSSYQVVFRHRAQVTAQNTDERGFTLKNVVPGSLVLVDYQWKLPRTDLLTIDRNGLVRRIEGISSLYRTVVPELPAGQLALASIEQTWFDAVAPGITDRSTRAVAMSDLENMQQQIADLFDLVAVERLKNDLNQSDPVVKKGVFVDPFLDDDLRDQGVNQTAAVIDGILTLPIDVEVSDLALLADDRPQTLRYGLEEVLVQAQQTGSMKINPYDAFEPLPAVVTLSPSRDHWTETRTTMLSSITRRIFRDNFRGDPNVRRSWRTWFTTRTNTQTERVSSSTTQGQFMRSRSVAFEIKGFGDGEQVSEVTFDGLTVAVSPQ